MMRSYVGLMIAAFAVLFAAPAAASTNSIAGALGNLRWGMSEREVRTALKGKINGPLAEFDGKSTRWDSSPIAEEYTHGNEEAMLTSTDKDGVENYYFLIGGQLWKWVKVYPASAFGGHDFNRFAEKVKARFGQGYDKQGEVNPGSGASYHFLEFLDRNTRLRAVDKTSKQNQYVLMFEAMDTVRSLSSLRMNTIRRATSKRSSSMASASPASAPASEPPKSVAPRAQQNGKKNKSIFADEGQQDSAADYAAKKQRAQNEAREKQRHTYERNEEAKKGKTLDDLAGMDDDDPISGAH